MFALLSAYGGSAPQAQAMAPRITYDSQQSPAGLWSAGVDGSSPQPFYAGGFGSSWSENGGRVSFQTGSTDCYEGASVGEVEAMNPDGSGLTQLAFGCDARISPDATRVVFQPGPDDIAVVGATEQSPMPHDITPCTNSYINECRERGAYYGELTERPAWLGNGTIVYQAGGLGGIDTVSVSGGLPTPVPGTTPPNENESGKYTFTNGLAANPAGTLIVSAGWENGSKATEGLFTMAPSGGIKLIVKTPEGKQYVDPQFSPDGKTIVFEDYERESHTSHAMTIPASGGAASTVPLSDTTVENPSFAPPATPATIAGSVLSVKKEGLAGVEVRISGSTSGGQPASYKATTIGDGSFSQEVAPGSYTVAPAGTPPGQAANGSYATLSCSGSAGAGTCSLAIAAGKTLSASFEYVPPHNQVSIALEPSTTSTDGFGAIGATITDTGPDGQPVAGQAIRIEPPVTYEQPALVCDEAGSLAYPTRLADGFILGAGFTRTTDSAGQVHLTVLMGTVAGDWLLEAGEPKAPLSQWGHAELSVGETGGRTELKPELPAELVAASNDTLSDFKKSGLQDALEWLGQLKTGSDNVLAGVGFVPIWARDPGGFLNAGVVLFANSPTVRQALFNYLDGKTSVPPPESQAIVIDVSRMRQLLFSAYLAEQKISTVGYRLPSLAEWEKGTVVAIGENLLREHPHIPIPARGRPHAGFFEPHGSEALVYEYGPYPPAASSPATRMLAEKCIGSAPAGAETPETGRTTVTAHSPVTLLATGADGQQAGIGPNGRLVTTIPGALVRYRGRRATQLQLPPGAYKLSVTGTGGGRATLVVTTQATRGNATEVFSFQVHKGERGNLSLPAGAPTFTMRLGRRLLRGVPGLKLTVKGLPRALRHGVSRTLSLAVSDQFGQPAAGVTVSVGGPAGTGKTPATSGANGKLSVTIDPRVRGRLTLAFSGAGYLTRRYRIGVS